MTGSGPPAAAAVLWPSNLAISLSPLVTRTYGGETITEDSVDSFTHHIAQTSLDLVQVMVQTDS